MRICSLSSSLANTFKSMGHEVLALESAKENTLLDLPSVLSKHDFVPDLVFQEEFLGNRVILQGLEQLDCPKIFWSLDTHLNLFWQAHYFRLFDGIMTPHAEMLRQSGLQCPPFARLARFGYELPWRPHAQRPYKVAFVGRQTEHRPLRLALVDFLKEQYEAAIFSDIPFPQMLEQYMQSCLAPNEAIAAEVNFRLMETASCGCLVFSQNIGPDQDVLFTPGMEIQTYEDITELRELMDHFIARPDLAERKARAAWERIRAEHLASHRAQAVLDFAAGLSASAAKGDAARSALWLTLWAMRKGGRNSMPLPRLENALQQLPVTPDVLAAMLDIKIALKDSNGFLEIAAALLATENLASDIRCNLAGSLGALLLDAWSLAKQFWYRQTRSDRQQSRRRPENPAELCLLWAVELQRMGLFHQPGLGYSPGRHTPGSALECLELALRYDSDNQKVLRKLEEVHSQIKGNDFFRMGYLSLLSLGSPYNWRTGLTLGLLNLRTFRLQQGLEELTLAHTQALQQGREKSFYRTLARMDQRGYIKNALAQYLKAAVTPRTAAQTNNQAD